MGFEFKTGGVLRFSANQMKALKDINPNNSVTISIPLSDYEKLSDITDGDCIFYGKMVSVGLDGVIIDSMLPTTLFWIKKAGTEINIVKSYDGYFVNLPLLSSGWLNGLAVLISRRLDIKVLSFPLFVAPYKEENDGVGEIDLTKSKVVDLTNGELTFPLYKTMIGETIAGDRIDYTKVIDLGLAGIMNSLTYDYGDANFNHLITVYDCKLPSKSNTIWLKEENLRWKETLKNHLIAAYSHTPVIKLCVCEREKLDARDDGHCDPVELQFELHNLGTLLVQLAGISKSGYELEIGTSEDEISMIPGSITSALEKRNAVIAVNAMQLNGEVLEALTSVAKKYGVPLIVNPFSFMSQRNGKGQIRVNKSSNDFLDDKFTLSIRVLGLLKYEWETSLERRNRYVDFSFINRRTKFDKSFRFNICDVKIVSTSIEVPAEYSITLESCDKDKLRTFYKLMVADCNNANEEKDMIFSGIIIGGDDICIEQLNKENSEDMRFVPGGITFYTRNGENTCEIYSPKTLCMLAIQYELRGWFFNQCIDGYHIGVHPKTLYKVMTDSLWDPIDAADDTEMVLSLTRFCDTGIQVEFGRLTQKEDEGGVFDEYKEKFKSYLFIPSVEDIAKSESSGTPQYESYRNMIENIMYLTLMLVEDYKVVGIQKYDEGEQEFVLERILRGAVKSLSASLD